MWRFSHCVFNAAWETQISSWSWGSHSTDRGSYGQGYGQTLITTTTPLLSLTLWQPQRRTDSSQARKPPLPNTHTVWNICVYGMSVCLNLFVAPLFSGLCSPLEKRLLRLGAHSPSRILLRHSSNTAGQDQAAHPLLWRYQPNVNQGFPSFYPELNRQLKREDAEIRETQVHDLHNLKKTWTWFQGHKGWFATSAADFGDAWTFPPVSRWDIDIWEVKQRLDELMFSSAWTLITLLMP